MHAASFLHGFEPQVPAQQFLDIDGKLQFGEPRADAAVNTVSEAQMPARILPADIEAICIVEHFAVAVGRQVPHHDLLALGDALSGQFGCRVRSSLRSGVTSLAQSDQRLRSCRFPQAQAIFRERYGDSLDPAMMVAAEGGRRFSDPKAGISVL